NHRHPVAGNSRIDSKSYFRNLEESMRHATQVIATRLSHRAREKTGQLAWFEVSRFHERGVSQGDGRIACTLVDAGFSATEVNRSKLCIHADHGTGTRSAPNYRSSQYRFGGTRLRARPRSSALLRRARMSATSVSTRGLSMT